MEIIGTWQKRLSNRIQSLNILRRYPLPISTIQSEPIPPQASEVFQGVSAPLPTLTMMLNTAHRQEAISLELWTSRAPDIKPWVLLSPGLGGGSHEFRRIAAALAIQGWPVIIASHPGSNDSSIREFLHSHAPLPSAESLKDRLKDLDVIIQAVRRQTIPTLGINFKGNEPVILMGHSLGAVGSLVYAGAKMTPRLSDRCRTATDPYPLTNISVLLQCYNPESLEAWHSQLSIKENNHESAGSIAAVIALNPFGSLFWPEENLASLPMPLLMVGGSFDLLTPPLEEQFTIFPAGGHPQNRLAIIEGGSHFYRAAGDGDYLLAINQELRGNNSLQIQELIATITTDFLGSIGNKLPYRGGRIVRHRTKAHLINGHQLPELKKHFSKSP